MDNTDWFGPLGTSGLYHQHVMQTLEITRDVAYIATEHVKARMNWLATREIHGPAAKRIGLLKQHHERFLEPCNDKRCHGRYTHDHDLLGARVVRLSS